MSRKKRKKSRAQRRLAQIKSMAKRSNYAAKKVAEGVNPRSGEGIVKDKQRRAT